MPLLEQPTLPLPRLVVLSASRRAPLLTCLQLPQRFHLLQHMLQQLFPPHDIEMPSDLRILAREALQCTFVQLPEVPFQHPWKLEVEFREQLGVEKQVGGRSQLFSNGIKEDFGTVVLVRRVSALATLHRREAHADNVGTVAEEKSFTSLLEKGSAEATSAAYAITFQHDLTVADAVNKRHDVFCSPSASNDFLKGLVGVLAVFELVLKDFGDVIAPTLPFFVRHFNAVFVRLDA